MLHALEWILFGATSVGAIILGVSRHRPARVAPWLLLAASVSCFTIGDVLYAFDLPVSEAFYLTMIVFVALAVMQFTRGGTLLLSRARLIDLLAGACASLLVLWVFVIGDIGRLGDISAVDVIGALLLIGVTARLVVATHGAWSATLLLIGATGMLTSDIVYGLHPSGWSEIGYMVLYCAWGAAALHPSMVRLTAPVPARPPAWQGPWAAVLGLSVATPPLVLLVEAVAGTVHDGVVIAVVGALTLVLTFTRLADSVALSNQALKRERALREASAALVAAADEPAVDKAVRAAVAQLLPAADLSAVEFVPDGRAALPTARDDMLVCPLRLEPLAVARPQGGALIITGRPETLQAGRDSLEVLAGQAALALDRINLVDAVGRRDSDLYLRAVVRNTADLMLVIDDDQVIRYASPALRTLLGGDELPPSTTFTELVHPDDSVRVRHSLRNGGDGTMHCSLQRKDETQVLVEATYRDLREDRLVRGYVLTFTDITRGHDPVEQIPHLSHVDDLPAWVNRRSAQHKFRY